MIHTIKGDGISHLPENIKEMDYRVLFGSIDLHQINNPSKCGGGFEYQPSIVNTWDDDFNSNKINVKLSKQIDPSANEETPDLRALSPSN